MDTEASAQFMFALVQTPISQCSAETEKLCFREQHVATAWIRAGKGLWVLEEAGRADEHRDLQVCWQKVLNKCCASVCFYFFLSALRVCGWCPEEMSN